MRDAGTAEWAASINLLSAGTGLIDKQSFVDHGKSSSLAPVFSLPLKSVSQNHDSTPSRQKQKTSCGNSALGLHGQKMRRPPYVPATSHELVTVKTESGDVADSYVKIRSMRRPKR